jgi:hypothetical protein
VPVKPVMAIGMAVRLMYGSGVVHLVPRLPDGYSSLCG